jgi:hypothetical protein
MWNLTSPDIASVRLQLDTVFPEDVIPVVATEADKDSLEELYEDYRVALGRPNDDLMGPNLAARLKEAIHDAYKEVQVTGKLSALRNSLKLLATECPYCGFGQIQDLDHHLPKAVFKPFSIYPLNLVPCCATCNRGKPRKPRKDENSHLLHPYLEDVSAHDFMEAAVSLDPMHGSLQVKFNVVKTAGMSVELHQRLLNHFDVFDLNERYVAQVNIYLGGLEAALEQAFEIGGAASLRDFLLRSSAMNSRRFGRNDWRTALLLGLAASDDFYGGGYKKALGYGQPENYDLA